MPRGGVWGQDESTVDCRPLGPEPVAVTQTAEGEPSRELAVKNCKLCRFRNDCKDLPGYCLLINWIGILILLATLGYLFFTGLAE